MNDDRTETVKLEFQQSEISIIRAEPSVPSLCAQTAAQIFIERSAMRRKLSAGV